MQIIRLLKPSTPTYLHLQGVQSKDLNLKLSDLEEMVIHMDEKWISFTTKRSFQKGEIYRAQDQS